MTPDPWPEAGAVLVRAAHPPAPPAGRVLDVRPGTGTVFDGGRWRRTLAVDVLDDGRGRGGGSFETRERRDALAAVARRLEARDVDVVRFGNRARLRAHWPAPVVRGTERRLAGAARRFDGLLVTWTDGMARPTDGKLYDAVLD